MATDRLDLHVFFHLSQDHSGGADRKLDLILARIGVVMAQEQRIMSDLTALQTQVEENTDLEQSAITLLNGLGDKLAEAGTDPAKLAALQGSLKSSASGLAAAIVKNTPAA